MRSSNEAHDFRYWLDGDQLNRSMGLGVIIGLRGGLDVALHKRANVAHGDGEIVMGLQVNPELRSVAEIAAEA